jgi:hypothetical protein
MFFNIHHLAADELFMSANCQSIGRAYDRTINRFEEPFRSHRNISAAGL